MTEPSLVAPASAQHTKWTSPRGSHKVQERSNWRSQAFSSMNMTAPSRSAQAIPSTLVVAGALLMGTLVGTIAGTLIGGLVGGAFAADLSHHTNANLLPVLALIPLSVSSQRKRSNLPDARPKALTMLRDVGIAAAVAGVVAAGCAVVALALGVPLRQGLPVAAFTAVLAALVGLVVPRSMRLRQPDVQSHHVLFEHLTEQLTAAGSREDVVSVIERTVRDVVPCEEVLFVPFPKTGSGSSESGEGPRDGDLPTVSIRSSLHGRVAGALQVRKKRGQVFSREEVALLRSIASHATFGLALVDRVDALDHQRKKQADAWEAERAAVIEALAAEIAHEVRYPINFFRSIFLRDTTQRQLDEEELDIGCEEVERLERLVGDLRKVAVRRLERRHARLTDLIARAEMLLRDRLDGRSFEVTVPSRVCVRCDPDQVTQVLVNLMANAVSATKNDEDLGVDWAPDAKGGTLKVWDRGPGFVSPPSLIFTPWFTTKSTGTGLGLAITHRIVRAHGWAVDPSREDGLTCFSISIPLADIRKADDNAVASSPRPVGLVHEVRSERDPGMSPIPESRDPHGRSPAASATTEEEGKETP